MLHIAADALAAAVELGQLLRAERKLNHLLDAVCPKDARSAHMPKADHTETSFLLIPGTSFRIAFREDRCGSREPHCVSPEHTLVFWMDFCSILAICFGDVNKKSPPFLLILLNAEISKTNIANPRSSEAIAGLNEERPLLSRWALPARLPDIQRSFLSVSCEHYGSISKLVAQNCAPAKRSQF